MRGMQMMRRINAIFVGRCDTMFWEEIKERSERRVNDEGRRNERAGRKQWLLSAHLPHDASMTQPWNAPSPKPRFRHTIVPPFSSLTGVEKVKCNVWICFASAIYDTTLLVPHNVGRRPHSDEEEWSQRAMADQYLLPYPSQRSRETGVALIAA